MAHKKAKKGCKDTQSKKIEIFQNTNSSKTAFQLMNDLTSTSRVDP